MIKAMGNSKIPGVLDKRHGRSMVGIFISPEWPLMIMSRLFDPDNTFILKINQLLAE